MIEVFLSLCAIEDQLMEVVGNFKEVDRSKDLND